MIWNINEPPPTPPPPSRPILHVLVAWLGPLAVLMKRFSMRGNFKGDSVQHDESVCG